MNLVWFLGTLLDCSQAVQVGHKYSQVARCFADVARPTRRSIDALSVMGFKFDTNIFITILFVLFMQS
jgi:hypothetical protein